MCCHEIILCPQSSGLPSPSSNCIGASGTDPHPIPQMDISHLDGIVQYFIGCSIASSTRAAYKSAQRRYHAFCTLFGVEQPYPLREETMCRFVAFLAGEGLKHRSIKAYLAGVRFANIAQDYGNPFLNGAMPRLEYTLWGIKKHEVLSGAPPPKPRLPITISVLRSLKSVWLAAKPHHPDCVMLWAAACTGF